MSNTPAVTNANPTASEQVLFTVNEVAGMLGISRATVNNLFRKGELTRLKIGNSTRVSVKGINRYVDYLERQAKERGAATVKGQR